jgi:hypothetical protein
MKKINVMSVIGLLLASAGAQAADDQSVEIVAFESINNSRANNYKAECKQIEKDAQERMNAFLSVNPDMNPSQVNVMTKFSYDFNYRGGPMGGFGGGLDYPQRIYSCALRVRLNDDTRKLSIAKSDVYYTGSGKYLPCKKLKSEIDKNPGVIYSEVNNNLIRCNVKPIILIEKK